MSKLSHTTGFVAQSYMTETRTRTLYDIDTCHPRASGAALILSGLWLIAACSSGTDDNAGGDTGTPPTTVGGNGVSITSGSSTTSPTIGTGGSGPYMLPPGFTRTEYGGYKLGAPDNGNDSGAGGSSAGAGCGTTIVGVVRDFKRGDRDGGHPDFETFTGEGERGIVEDALGSDRKPVYVDTSHVYTTNKQNFDQWYRNVDGTNQAYAVSLSFEPNGNVLTFHSADFFPIDGVGFGNENENHNFHFTTEVHTMFVYQGGERFTFTGDDDLWVFINNQLAIDLGGLHPERSQGIDIDDEARRLGLEVGGVYSLDLFHAERHTDESNFRVETNLAFTNCGEILDPVVK